MRYIKLFVASIAVILTLASCGSLLPATITKLEDVENYKYFYIEDTKELTSSSGGVFSTGQPYGVFGLSSTSSVNPSDVISGYLIKKQFVRLPALIPDLGTQTIIINYGECGKRDLGFAGDAIEVTIQFVSAQTLQTICTCTAENKGDTEADCIRNAITRCLDKVFENTYE